MQSYPDFLQPQYSMGKHLRHLKGLYTPEKSFTILEPTPLQKTLLSDLKSKGFESSKVSLAQFSLKNGLPYSGLINTDNFYENEVIFKVPTSVILNTRAAFLSEIQVILDENPDVFMFEGEFYHEYLLLFFILYEFQKGKDSIWFNYINTLPKELDFLALWKEEELEFLEENGLVCEAKRNYVKDLEEFEVFRKIAIKYPQFFKEGTFERENYMWIKSILQNRTFWGKYKYLSLIPFVDMFNYENVRTYRKHNLYNVQNKNKEEKNDTNEDKIHEKCEENYETTEHTNNEIDFDDLPEISKNSGEELLISNLLIKKAVDFFKEKADFDDLTSLTFLGRLIAFIEEKSRETPDFHDKITMILNDYYQNLHDFYSDSSKNIEYSKNFSKNQEKSNENTEKTDWNPENFDEIEFITNKNEFFLKNSQMFLCYGGGFSNKKLLTNYGFCIEYNKYDKVFLNIYPSFFYEETSIYSQFMKNIGYSPYFQQIKLKYTSFNTNLIIFFKIFLFNFEEHQINDIFLSKNLVFEIKAIEKILAFLKTLVFSKDSLQDNEKLLFDSKIGYNHYFSVIYKLEKQRITQFNINLYDISLQILQKIHNGCDKNQAFSKRIAALENEEEFLRNRYILSPYMNKCEFSH